MDKSFQVLDLLQLSESGSKYLHQSSLKKIGSAHTLAEEGLTMEDTFCKRISFSDFGLLCGLLTLMFVNCADPFSLRHFTVSRYDGSYACMRCRISFEVMLDNEGSTCLNLLTDSALLQNADSETTFWDKLS